MIKKTLGVILAALMAFVILERSNVTSSPFLFITLLLMFISMFPSHKIYKISLYHQARPQYVVHIK